MKRITSIDFVRGLIMIIMALDHVRDFMHLTSLTQSPTDLHATTAGLFFTRWITYLCAPGFVFLAGLSAYISLKRRNNLAGSKKFLLKRGLWLIVLEFTVINFALWFDIHFRVFILEVICAIGAGFIILSFLLKLRTGVIGIIGLCIIFGHNLLDSVSSAGNTALNTIFSIFFSPNVMTITPHLTFIVAYPLIPWLGIMLVGFACGPLYDMPAGKRRKLFWRIGAAALILFCVLRFANVYGDPSKWSVQKTPLFTFLSFMNIVKYPPSLLFDLVTLGILLLILCLADGRENKFVNVVAIYGKVPLFYFVIHLYLIHTLMFVMLYLQGFGFHYYHFTLLSNGRPASGSGVRLRVIYLIWAGVVLALYPVCYWYAKYKAAHPDYPWLRYL
jgi:uncharacterized membrane protein